MIEGLLVAVCGVTVVTTYVLSRLHYKLVGLLLAILAPALISYGLGWILFSAPWSHPNDEGRGFGPIITLVWSYFSVPIGLVSYLVFWGIKDFRSSRRSNNRLERSRSRLR